VIGLYELLDPATYLIEPPGPPNNIEDDGIELSTKDEIPSSTEDIIDDNNNKIEDDII